MIREYECHHDDPDQPGRCGDRQVAEQGSRPNPLNHRDLFARFQPIREECLGQANATRRCKDGRRRGHRTHDRKLLQPTFERIVQRSGARGGRNAVVAKALPPRPDDGTDGPVLAPPRRRTSRGIIALIVVSSLVFVVMIAVFVNATLDSQENQVQDIFHQVQYCMNHPKDPSCDFSPVPSP
jgi:hypothetical protein